ncbi:hypothetical protein BJ322DRAFT_1021628 [Thelephora terrestris]|uniref:Uncharacterized protein n=1 Tax=Thelephora terrestris TaxID=56493 RepID=A0A9P6L626_9AGAM|nr:hypothetical protein BJ322DRAFT_1021628 [Thelephora terrestris]
MTRKSLVKIPRLECLAFAVTILLAVSDVGAEAGSNGRTPETSGVVGGVSKANCYDNRNKGVKCTKKKAIIVGSVISSLFVILGLLLLYATFSERRKKCKVTSTTEESEPLSNGAGASSDCEKGTTNASMKDNHEDNDDSMHLDKPDEAPVSRTSSITSNLSSYNRTLDLTLTHEPVKPSDPDRAPLARP